MNAEQNSKREKTGKRIRQIVLALFLIFLFRDSSGADWTIYKKIEKRNIEGNVLRIDTDFKSKIRAWFILKEKILDVFTTKLPIYQIDDNDVRDLQRIKGKTVRKNQWIRWVISAWKPVPDPDLLEIINGDEITFQYYLPDGRIEETTFQLDGIRESIKEVLE